MKVERRERREGGEVWCMRDEKRGTHKLLHEGEEDALLRSIARRTS
jgi:hypothetical protein